MDWHDANGGGEILELFYYQKPQQRWRQIWVSDLGQAKERESVAGSADRIVFLGEVRQLDGGTHLDRSLFVPQPGGRIHQIIEISRDAGKSWQLTFDGEYRPVE